MAEVKGATSVLERTDLPGTGPDDGPTVGLESAVGVEVQAPWYERRAWAFEVSWTVPFETPPEMRWLIVAAVEYDEASAVTRRHPTRPTWVWAGKLIRFQLPMSF